MLLEDIRYTTQIETYGIICLRYKCVDSCRSLKVIVVRHDDLNLLILSLRGTPLSNSLPYLSVLRQLNV